MTVTLNALAHSSSAYLRSAMHQPVRWHSWGDDAFALAAQEDKPVLLDIGAVWCHWCHVMDRESYENPAIAAVINEHFIAIKVDRDERPDVDSRYQAAVQAMAGQGGWPLTAILTPEGKPFFGGTYFPPEDRYGRPGFERVLRSLADVWQNRRGEALETANSVLGAIEHGESFAGRSGTLSIGIVEKLVSSAVQQFDARYGGFGSQPKFPHPSAMDMLIDTAARTGNERVRDAATVTLRKMAAGGVYDQLAGGFHRYSVDEQWIVPHFEKMLYDNAGLLSNYVHAFQSFVEPEFATVAIDIIRWMDECLSDRERGGFYASQDADINLDDDGDYFTWTLAEARAVLSGDELAVAASYFDIGEMGDMHHNPQKNVLHSKRTLAEVAAGLGLSAEEAHKTLDIAKSKLLAARRERPTPFIDTTIYTSWNALAISAYLQAARVLDLPHARTFALLTLNRILREAWSEASGLSHVVAYAGGKAPAAWVAGVLDDYAFLTDACLEAWESTGDRKYYDAAAQVADAMIARFYDQTSGAFFDTEIQGSKLGALAARRKPLQDTPTPAGNPAAVSALLRLAALSGEKRLAELAEDTLEAFAGVVEHFGLYAGTYGLALLRFLLPPTQIIVVGGGPRARELAAMAVARYAVNKSVVQFDPAQLAVENLPPALAETLPHLSGFTEPVALVCQGMSCQPPITEPQALLEALHSAV
uniref:Thioredoxin domain-containing protein n=1 Tax=Acidobacterium capsulatum TaxID=33075 RepID=A0A7V4XTI6_9BACT